MKQKAAPTTNREDFPPEVATLYTQQDEPGAMGLRDLAEGRDRALAKAARRALFLLKQAGIEPPAAPPTAAVVSRLLAQKVASQAFVSNIDGNGSQMLNFVQEDVHGGSPWLISFLVSYGSGLKDLGCDKMPRRNIEESFASMREKPGRLLVEMPVDYARYRLQQAVSLNREESLTIPQGYSEQLERVGLPEQEYPRALVYDYLDAEAVKQDKEILHDPEKLFELDTFRGWLLNLSLLPPWIDKIYEAHNSPLALDEAQKVQRGEKVIDEATDALLGEEGILVYRQMLEESALVFHLAGAETEAKQTLYHALSFEDGVQPHAIPFARALTSRSLYVLISLYAKEAEERQQAQEEAERLRRRY